MIPYILGNIQHSIHSVLTLGDCQAPAETRLLRYSPPMNHHGLLYSIHGRYNQESTVWTTVLHTRERDQGGMAPGKSGWSWFHGFRHARNAGMQWCIVRTIMNTLPWLMKRYTRLDCIYDYKGHLYCDKVYVTFMLVTLHVVYKVEG